MHAGSDVRVKVNIVGSQDTTGLMTSQELEAKETPSFLQRLMVPTSLAVILHPSGTKKLRSIFQS